MVKNIVTMMGSFTVPEAIKLIDQYQVNFLPIVDDHKLFYGVVSWRDLIKSFPPKTKLYDIAQTNVWTIQEDSNCKSAANLMVEKKIHHLIVLRDKKIVGIVSSLDLLKSFSD